MVAGEDRGVAIETRYGARARLSLLDFLDFADLGADLVSRGKEAYDRDVHLRLSGEAIVHKLGEAVARLPDELIDAHPEVPFRRVRRMRNLVAHAYDRADPEILWTTMSTQLPDMARQVGELLDGPDSGDENRDRRSGGQPV